MEEGRIPKELNPLWNVGSAIKRSHDKKKGGGWPIGLKNVVGGSTSYVTVDLLREKESSPHSLCGTPLSFFTPVK